MCICMPKMGLLIPPTFFFFFLIIVVYKKNLETAGLSNRVRSALSMPLQLKEKPSGLASCVYCGCGCWSSGSHSSCSSGLSRLFLWVSIVVTGLTDSILEVLGWHNTSQQNYSWQGRADGNAYLCHLKPTRDTRIWAITINRKKKNSPAFLVTHTQVHWRCLAQDL